MVMLLLLLLLRLPLMLLEIANKQYRRFHGGERDQIMSHLFQLEQLSIVQ